MTPEIAGFLLLFVAAIVLFAVEWVSADVIALGLMLTLIITGMLPTDVAFAGFGSDAVLMILGLLILTEALVKTGFVDVIGGYLHRLVGDKPRMLTFTLMVVPAITSSFISNTASSAFFLPITLGLANRAKLSASKLLMPLAFGTILASSVTLIGTSTNVVVSGIVQGQGMEPLTMFELTPIGLPILVVGVLYMYLIGRRLIPDRTGVPSEDMHFSSDLYLSEVAILPHSESVGRTIEESPLMKDLQLGVLRLLRGGESIKPLADTILHENDVLLVEGKREDVLAINTTPGLEVKGTMETMAHYAEGEATQIAEVVLLPGSRLIGRTIQGLRLRERYKLQILAMNQQGRVSYSKLGRRLLRLGDILLIQIPRDNIQPLESERLFRILDIIEEPPRGNGTGIWQASLIFVGVIALAALGVLPIAAAVLLGALLVFLAGSITPDEAYRKIEWKVLILIGSMLAFGRAMVETGTADYLAEQIILLAGDTSPRVVLALFFVITMLLTQVMSNQAAAAVITPIALQAAGLLGLNPRTFAVMIAVAASTSFITPLEPACVIVYGAGKYRFFDFIRVGAPLTVLIFLIAIVFVPMLWHV